jgi:hypothetical protein
MLFDEIEKMDISASGKLLGMCTAHTKEFMKQHRGPISAAELLKKLEKDAINVGIPKTRGMCPRGEAYRCAITSLEAKRFLIKDSNWKLIWHENV